MRRCVENSHVQYPHDPPPHMRPERIFNAALIHNSNAIGYTSQLPATATGSRCAVKLNERQCSMEAWK
jgi:hypothetical protein